MLKLLHSYSFCVMPRTLFGIARTLDLGAVFMFYNFSDSDEEADASALTSDWLAVGADLHQAIHQYEVRFRSHQDDDDVPPEMPESTALRAGA